MREPRAVAKMAKRVNRQAESRNFETEGFKRPKKDDSEVVQPKKDDSEVVQTIFPGRK